MRQLSMLLFFLLAIPYSYGGVAVKQPGYIWEDHIVHFMYNDSISQSDIDIFSKVLDSAIDMYSKNTCINFIGPHLKASEIPKHHLLINLVYNHTKASCKSKGGVRLNPDNKNQMTLNLWLTTREERVDECTSNHLTTTLKVLGLAFGIKQTHRRTDRDDYIVYHPECHENDELIASQFQKINETDELQNFEINQLAYECNSIMHFYGFMYNKDKCTENCECNVLIPKPGSSCKEISPSPVPTKLDWDLINLAQNCPIMS